MIRAVVLDIGETLVRDDRYWASCPNGRLDTTLQRTGQVEKDVGELETRVAALERARWPLPTIGVLTGVAGAATGALALLR